MKLLHCALLAWVLWGLAMGAEETRPAAPPSPEPKTAAPATATAPATEPAAAPARPATAVAPVPNRAAPNAGPAVPASDPAEATAPSPVAGPAPIAPTTAETGSGTTGWDRYQILIKRNVFSKSRGREREESRVVVQKPPPKPEAETFLVGIAEKDGELVAFFENRKTGTIQKARKDEPVARGKIASITLNNIEYDCDGKVLVVAMGNNLEGGTVSKSGDAGSTAAAPTGSPAAAPGSGDAGSILERLRRKRLEEMNK